MNKIVLNKRLTLLIPYILIAILFILVPIILLVVKGATPVSSTFDNWHQAKTASFWTLIGRSLLVGSLTSIITLVIALPFSFLVANSKNKNLKVLAITFAISPLLIFTLAKVLAIKGLFLSMFDENILNRLWFMILGLSYLNLPFMILPLYSVFTDMPKSLIEASVDLGMKPSKTLLKVIIPYSFKAIISGFALVFMLSSTSIVASEKLLPDGSQLRLPANLMNELAKPQNAFDIAQASTISLITVGVMLAIYGMIYTVPYFIRKIKGDFYV